MGQLGLGTPTVAVRPSGYIRRKAPARECSHQRERALDVIADMTCNDDDDDVAVVVAAQTTHTKSICALRYYAFEVHSFCNPIPYFFFMALLLFFFSFYTYNKNEAVKTIFSTLVSVFVCYVVF